MNTDKNYYPALDVLRFVAAVMVLGYHLFEAVAFAADEPRQMMYHGFLAVDFFLLLSGFVMGQAYDGRWGDMTVKDFFKKRLIRLHPMVILGVFIGLAVFLAQGALRWDATQAGPWNIILSLLLALLLLPSPTALDIRGNTEMFPLNGPHWSLFFEYIGNIIYALLIRRLSTKALKIWVAVSAACLLAMGFLGPDGSIAYGWSSRPVNILGGFLRMNFAYPAGLLLARLYREKRPRKIESGGITICTAALVFLLCMPFLGETAGVLYQVFCVTMAFPAIIWLGAKAGLATDIRHCRLLGGMSYTLYAVHYPFIYLYIGWINGGTNPFGPQWWSTPLALTVICLVLSYLTYRFYDNPVRKMLSRTTSDRSFRIDTTAGTAHSEAKNDQRQS